MSELHHVAVNHGYELTKPEKTHNGEHGKRENNAETPCVIFNPFDFYTFKLTFKPCDRKVHTERNYEACDERTENPHDTVKTAGNRRIVKQNLIREQNC
jgi:hypothetical protein